MGDRILVTGGAGFIGSHLVEALVRNGASVVVLDDLSTGRAENLAGVDVEVVEGSVLDAGAVQDLVVTSDVVVHLAAAVGVRRVVEDPVGSIRTNVRGTEIVLDAVARRGARVLLASTSEVYGKSANLPFREDDGGVYGATSVARWGYALAKSLDEVLALALHREGRLRAIVVRLFNTVGPRQTGAYGMVIPRLVSQALEGEPLTVYGDGRQTRCFCHVTDAVDALVRLLGEPHADGEIFNVGSTEEVSILELAHRVIDAVGSSSEVRLVPYDEAFPEGFEDMRRRIPDIRKIGSVVGWRPRRTLDELIADVVADARTAPS